MNSIVAFLSDLLSITINAIIILSYLCKTKKVAQKDK